MKPLPAQVTHPVEYDLHVKRTWAWGETEKLAAPKKGRSDAIRLMALREFLKRTDPEPRGPLPDESTRPIAIQVNLGVAVNGGGNGHALSRTDADAQLREGSLTIHLGGSPRTEP